MRFEDLRAAPVLAHLRRYGGWVLALIVLGAVLQQQFAPADARTAGGRELRVGLYDNAPKIYRLADGSAAGLFPELLEEIAAVEGWRLRHVPCEWAQCLEMLGRGELDLMPDVAFSPARARQFDFHTHAVAYGWSQVYTSAQREVMTLADLDGGRIAVMRGSVQEAVIDGLMLEAGLHYQRVAVDSLAEGFQAVVDGRADAVVTNNFFAGWHNPRYGLLETPIVFQPVSLYFAAPKEGSAELLARIDHHLGEWRRDAGSRYYEALRRAMASTPADPLSRLMWLSLAGALALALALGALVLLLRWQVALRTRELMEANRSLNSVLAAGPCVLYALRPDHDGYRTEWVSANVERLFGFTPQAAQAPGWWLQQVCAEDRERALGMMARLAELRHMTHEYRIIDAAGRIRHIRDELQVVGEGREQRIHGLWSDLTEAREQEARLSFLANHDAVTGLPNRTLLNDRLEHALQRARAEGGSLVLLFIDLDRFKNVNDSLGHAVGDQMLRIAAARIGALLRAEDTLARVGGDEFVVLLEDYPASQVPVLAGHLLTAFAEPMVADAHSLVLTASVGVSLFPADGQVGEALLMHAELAMYEAKKAGRNAWRFFAPQLGETVSQRLVLENGLRHAIERNELVVHYQPQFDLSGRRLVGAEALVRWQHPEQGLLPPGLFIGLAEEIGLIGRIDAWVLEEACRQLAEWDRAGLHLPRVGVNLSAQELDGDRLVERVAGVLAANGLGPERLELEVTESMIMHDPLLAESTLGRLRALGVHLAVDDFGTGYSSLAYLKRLPIGRLKIDRSFVQDIGRSVSDESIVHAVVALARSLRLETVAEGVEDENQVSFLRAAGCDVGQGYLFARPLPTEAFVALLGSEDASA